MEQLKDLDSLNLREKKKYAGIPEGGKLKPACCLSSVSEEEVYYAVLEGGASSGLAGLNKARGFTIRLFDRKEAEVLRLEDRAGFFTRKMEVRDASRDLLGSVQKCGGSKNHFQAKGVGGQVLYDIEGPTVFRELFPIRGGNMTLGRISRRPTRIAEEGVSRNDHFGIVFPLAAEVPEKAVLLGALFLIDLLF